MAKLMGQAKSISAWAFRVNELIDIDFPAIAGHKRVDFELPLQSWDRDNEHLQLEIDDFLNGNWLARDG